MLKNIKKRNEGFTIIEVLIVLAIAGLILLVVFLAVPALQRNSRNTQRTQDIASVLGVVTEYTNNNNGILPTTSSVATDGTLTLSGATGTNSVTVKLGYYTGGITVSTTAPGASGVNTSTEDTAIIYKGAKCNTAGTQAVDGPSRSVAVAYTLESGSKQCKAS